MRHAPLSPSLLLLAAAALPAQDHAPSVFLHATAEVDAAQTPATGRAVLRLRFECEAAPGRPYAIRVELRRGGTLLLRRDHTPPVPTREWSKDKPVAYELPLVLPLDAIAAGEVEVFLGLIDPATGNVAPPLSRDIGSDNLARVGTFTLAALGSTPDAAAVDAVIASALAAKDPQDAWDQLEFTFRRLDDYPLKAKLQKALLTVGQAAPRPLTFEESAIVQGRIQAERARYLRQVAGRMFDRGRLLGALQLLDEVGGALQEQADRAVLGALADATRVTQDRDGIAAKVFALTKEQQAEVARLVDEHPKGQERLEFGQKLAKDPARRGIARELVRTLEFTPELRAEGEQARAAIEKAWLADVPADERSEAEAAMKHPCWSRTAQRVSHRFVLIGPQQLVAGVPADSLLRFDLAYLYLTDLFGRVPNPEGDRVTVYWKELWEFGGGVGGGKVIDIGSADPAAKALRVDNGLLYHELTHCIDDTAPVYGGMHEGLADFGATFAQQELGQVAGARLAFGIAARAFQEDYLERDLEYWRIPNYGPSAGFFLHFVATYGKSGNGYRWELYRKFFRDYRADKVQDGRTPDVARAFAFHLVEAFGEAAFADLVRFRWPLLPQDLEAVRLEQRAATKRQLGPTLADAPGSPVPRDRTAQQLHGEGAGAQAWHDRLGVVIDWWVIGPFCRDGVDPGDYRFAPELEVDLAARYESPNNNPTWRRPGPRPVTVDDTGWLHFEFSYMDDTATYAMTHVTVAAATEAWFHVRADDDLSLFVDDEQIGAYENTGGPLGPWRPGWQVPMPDAIRFPVTLHPGRNKVLLKIRNHRGGSGCSLAIAQRNGEPLPGWTTDAEPPAKKLTALPMPDPKRWSSKLRLHFDGDGSVRKLDATVGKFRARNGALEGTANDRQVEWRKYTVRPGFPKDSPSNLLWLPERATADVDAFQFTADLPAGSPPPKLCVIFQGEGRRDALSGWTLILEPAGGDGARAYLERYDRRCYQSDRIAWPVDAKAAKEPTRLEVFYCTRRVTVRLGANVLFDQAPIAPIPGKTRIGIATWGDDGRLETLELKAPSRTR